MARSRFHALRQAVVRRANHPLHQPGHHANTPYRKAVLSQQTMHHPTGRAGAFQMRFIHPRHQGQKGRRNRARNIVERPPADAERLGAFRQRQDELTINHPFAFSKPALVSAPAKDSFLSVNTSILARRCFTSTDGAAGSASAFAPFSAASAKISPKARALVPAWSSRHATSPPQHHPALRQKGHLPKRNQFPETTLCHSRQFFPFGCRDFGRCEDKISHAAASSLSCRHFMSG